MKIKLDENLPYSLARRLSELGHNADTVMDEGLSGATDPDVWAETQQEARFFITQDLDFSDIRQFKPGTHHGILLIRLNNPTRQALTERILHLYQTEDVEMWQGCFVIVTDSKLRVRRP